MHMGGDTIELKVLGKISKPFDANSGQKTECLGMNNPTNMVVRGVLSLSLHLMMTGTNYDSIAGVS